MKYFDFDHLVLPKEIWVAKETQPAHKIMSYDLYGSKGNILQYTEESGTHVSIIWGYNESQPIAKIENFSYSTIPTTLIDAAQLASDTGTAANVQSAINTIRSNPLFKDAMITSYFYKPLIGVSGMTDPKGKTTYYDYDAMGRLKTVKDDENNILSANQYKYKN